MTRYLSLIVFAALLLSSCYSSRKAKIDKAIKNTSVQQEQELAQMNNIEKSKTEKLNEGKIDSTIDKNINVRLAENRNKIDSVKKILTELTATSSNRKALKKSYKKIIKSKLIYLKTESTQFNKKIVNYGLILDVLDNSKQSQFDLATFFGPGEFLIPLAKMEQAKIAFMPVVDSLLKFSAKYPGIQKNCTLVLKGYADATGVAAGTPLYYRLVNELKQTTATKTELNLALSKLRTQSISVIINQIIQIKQPDFTQQKIVNIQLIEEGRGDEKPNPKIMDYTDNDSRRRIVLFFWSLLPL